MFYRCLSYSHQYSLPKRISFDCNIYKMSGVAICYILLSTSVLIEFSVAFSGVKMFNNPPVNGGININYSIEVTHTSQVGFAGYV